MPGPFLIAQLSDPHVGAEWIAPDPGTLLSAAVAAVGRVGPDVVIVSGDLVENREDAEYERVREALEPLEAPVHVLPGNHDDRDALHRHFGVPGQGGEPVQYAVELGPLRLVVVDSTAPGHEHGELDEERLTWLDRELAQAPERPTLVAMHHPPLRTGAPAIDAIALRDDAQRGLGELLERHPQVLKVIAGHVHRTVTGDVGGRAVLAIPSVYAELCLAFEGSELKTIDGGRGYALHAVLDGALVSHVENLP
jgi:3',5'-cyclic-AMP phosphodiesterase